VDRDAYGGETVVLYDTFTEDLDALLENHTPDIGGPWIHISSSPWTAGGQKLRVQEAIDRVAPNATANTAAYYVDLTVTDVDVTFKVWTNHPSSGSAICYVRCDNDNFNGYGFGFGTGDELFLFRVVNGTDDIYYYTQGAGNALDTIHTIRFQMIGWEMKLWLNDVGDGDTPVYSGTESNQTFASGYVAIRLVGNETATTQADSLRVTEL
jgi:hypothetical protein